jgi:uncharacterized protein YndB with AHSA1/START domain
MSSEPIVIERTFNALVHKVWKAISARDEMKEWYFDIAEFKAEPGFEFEFAGGTEEKSYRHLCKVTEVKVDKTLTYSWRYDGYEGNSFVTFELFDEGNNTRLKLTHSSLETFPADNADFAKQNFQAGWTEIIGKMLKEYLERN